MKVLMVNGSPRQNGNTARALNKVYFVTGIDTGIGKTVATGLMARWLAANGHDVTTVKLVQTGNTGFSEDIAEHRRICGGIQLPEDGEGLTAPQIFGFPASPLLAASLEGKCVDLDAIQQAVAKCAERREIVLAEGAGGLAVPLTEDVLTVDFAASCGWPLILVTCGRLGSINHTLLSLEAAKARGMRVAGVVWNWCEGTDPAIDADAQATTRRYLAKFGFPPCIVEVPRLDPSGSYPAAVAKPGRARCPQRAAAAWGQAALPNSDGFATASPDIDFSEIFA